MGGDDREGAAPDRIEIWARRTGKALGYLFALALIANFFTHWLFE